MKITQRLLSYLNRVFDKDPHEFLALRLQYAGAMTWTVKDATLTTKVTTGPGLSLTVDLTQYTIAQLATFLAAQPGYSVVYLDASTNAQLGARVLIDGTASITDSNGDHITGYSSVLFALLESIGSELRNARLQLTEMLNQMSTRTASDVWLDELGGYYGIPRLASEPDAAYGPRIIAEVLRPRTNNVAIEQAIKTFTGQATKVTDVVTFIAAFPVYDGSITHNSTFTYNSTAATRYGLFDVQYGYDLENGGSFAVFQATITALIGRLRAAGTQLRSLTLTGSTLSDIGPTPTDDSPMILVVAPSLTDPLTAPTESLALVTAMPLADALASPPADTGSLTVTPSFFYTGLRRYDGAITHAGTAAYADAF